MIKAVHLTTYFRKWPLLWENLRHKNFIILLQEGPSYLYNRKIVYLQTDSKGKSNSKHIVVHNITYDAVLKR
jgi:hypothetical protein